jgi:hypothetical protein
MTALKQMNEGRLRVWLLARMRGERLDPPLSEGRLESPQDFVQAIVQESSDKQFHRRMQKAILGALDEAAAGNLREGPDAEAVRHLANLVDGLELRGAASMLQSIAERGVLGGHDDAIDPFTDEMVLFALAGIQAPGVLWQQWLALWNRDVPNFWPVASSGLRLSDPGRALSILPSAIERAAKHPEFPLGDILWAFANDGNRSASDIAAALARLGPDARARCRRALAGVGASASDIDAWLAELGPQPSATRAWLERPGLNKALPRFTPLAPQTQLRVVRNRV